MSAEDWSGLASVIFLVGVVGFYATLAKYLIDRFDPPDDDNQ